MRWTDLALLAALAALPSGAALAQGARDPAAASDWL